MVSDQFILNVQRLGDDIADLQKNLRRRYPTKTGTVTAKPIREQAGAAAEKWMVECVTDDGLAEAVEPTVLADINVHFQRLLNLADGTPRRRAVYDAELSPIQRNFHAQVVIPLKQLRAKGQLLGGTIHAAHEFALRQSTPEAFKATAFVGHSFATADDTLNQCVINTLIKIGLSVETGGKPKAERISDKVKRLIEAQHLFVGIFGRRDKLARKQEWTTSPWVIDEKAYALGRSKRLVLLKEEGVSSIGGLQGDYEFIEFSRSRLEQLVLGLLEIFETKVAGLRK